MGIPAHGVFALKRKASILVAGFVLLALGGVLVWRLVFPGRSAPPGQPAMDRGKNSALSLVIAAEAAKDSDGDGLKDWEEAIWHTDARKTDTDGDGTPDGEEVKQNRDPRIPGPNDRYTPVSVESDANGEGKPAPENLTAQLGARITGDLAASGGPERLDVRALASNYAEGLSGVRVLDGAPAFSSRDLTPAPTSDLLTILKFFTAIEEVWTKNFKPGQPTDVDAFFLAFEKGDAAALSGLERYRAGYQAAINAVRKTPVPAELQPMAVSLLDYLAKVKRSNELMQNFKADPLAAMLAIRERLALNEEFNAFVSRAVADSQTIVKKKVEELARSTKP